METVFLYLLKSSGLIAVFYLAYHFLVRKETFFNSNRWFLLSGLLTSLLLPLYFLEKTIWITRPKIAVQNVPVLTQQPITIIKNIPAVEAFDWMQFIWISYLIIACTLVVKIVLNLISLYRMLHKQQIVKDKQFKVVNLNDNIAPFSFFNYIVCNADLYSSEELKSIFLHEKIHSREKHSIDVLVAESLCAVFWFNPFMWLYKKAITQNLEYIADQKAIQQLADKKSYQHALLKVVSNQNCLPITNHFYQSLIKKRIVMLNKNQSRSTSYVKFAVVIPVLIAFVLLFQVKVIARDKFASEVIRTASKSNLTVEVIPLCETTPSVNESDVAYIFDKISSDNEIKSNVKDLKDSHNIDLTVSKLKRNSNGEIIAVKMTFNDNKGNVGKVEQDRTIPIRPIFFKVSKTPDGKNSIGFYDNPEMIVKPADPILENKIVTIESIKDDALIYVDGDRYDKEFLNELDPKGLEKIEILKDPVSLQQYGAQDKGEVVVITTNWTTKPAVPKQNAPSIFTLENGDEVVVFDRFNMKIPGYPAVQFTDSFPILIFNGAQQKNPRLALESMNLSKIKNIKVVTENDMDVKGKPIYKMIVSTK
ncbi:M56 family metallopeptidase [Flavobacterium sp. 25HG05S-40]|uniref:M56 family metallopeptidase n=1 Tax=Flavobacterium sp. 25HG05S-40 TaxID=3458682 RepID=UPI0040451895